MTQRITRSPLDQDATDPLRIERGLCHVLFAYDAARSIDLNEVERLTRNASERQTIPHKRRAPSYFEYRPPPLRVNRRTPTVQMGPYATRPNMDLVLYDFGAVTANYVIPLEGPFDKLMALSETLYDNALLLADSRMRVEELLHVIGRAATHPDIAPVVEDYVVFHVECLSQPFDAASFLNTYGRQVAQILRAEQRPLSNQEVEDALTARMSYGVDDIVIVDWNAALLIDREGEDVREVLQFANVELLEMRHLDQRLDGALDQSYETLFKGPVGLKARWRPYGASLRAVAELQVDNATLFEGVNNALKLLGDQYLARAYRLVSRRFHLDDWDTGILRKLQTLESIYKTLSDQAAARRTEVLEWVVIFLIAFEIVVGMVGSWHR